MLLYNIIFLVLFKHAVLYQLSLNISYFKKKKKTRKSYHFYELIFANINFVPFLWRLTIKYSVKL